jgi:hypothetical protein
MQFVLVNGRVPRPESSCVMCCEPIGESYLREIATRFSYCSLKCYATHCKLGVPVISSHVKASDIRRRAKPALPR